MAWYEHVFGVLAMFDCLAWTLTVVICVSSCRAATQKGEDSG